MLDYVERMITQPVTVQVSPGGWEGFPRCEECDCTATTRHAYKDGCRYWCTNHAPRWDGNSTQNYSFCEP